MLNVSKSRRLRNGRNFQNFAVKCIDCVCIKLRKKHVVLVSPENISKTLYDLTVVPLELCNGLRTDGRTGLASALSSQMTV